MIQEKGVQTLRDQHSRHTWLIFGGWISSTEPIYGVTVHPYTIQLKIYIIIYIYDIYVDLKKTNPYHHISMAITSPVHFASAAFAFFFSPSPGSSGSSDAELAYWNTFNAAEALMCGNVRYVFCLLFVWVWFASSIVVKKESIDSESKVEFKVYLLYRHIQQNIICLTVYLYTVSILKYIANRSHSLGLKHQRRFQQFHHRIIVHLQMDWVPWMLKG